MALPFNVIHKTEVGHRAVKEKYFSWKATTTNSLLLLSRFTFFVHLDIGRESCVFATWPFSDSCFPGVISSHTQFSAVNVVVLRFNKAWACLRLEY